MLMKKKRILLAALCIAQLTSARQWSIGMDNGVASFHIKRPIYFESAIGNLVNFADFDTKMAYLFRGYVSAKFGSLPTWITGQRKPVIVALEGSIASAKNGAVSNFYNFNLPGTILNAKQDIHRSQLMASARFTLFETRGIYTQLLGGVGANWNTLRNVNLYYRPTDGSIGQSLAPKKAAVAGSFGVYAGYKTDNEKWPLNMYLGYRISYSGVLYNPTILFSTPNPSVPVAYTDVSDTLGGLGAVNVEKAPKFSVLVNEFFIGVNVEF